MIASLSRNIFQIWAILLNLLYWYQIFDNPCIDKDGHPYEATKKTYLSLHLHNLNEFSNLYFHFSFKFCNIFHNSGNYALKNYIKLFTNSVNSLQLIHFLDEVFPKDIFKNIIFWKRDWHKYPTANKFQPYFIFLSSYFFVSYSLSYRRTYIFFGIIT